MADFPALADGIAASQWTIRFGVGNVGRDQSIRRTRGRILDDADTGRKRPQDQLMAGFMAAREHAQAETVAVQRDLADRGVIGLPGAQGGDIGKLGQPPASPALDKGRCKRAEPDLLQRCRQQAARLDTDLQHLCPWCLDEQSALARIILDADRQQAGIAFLHQQAIVGAGKAREQGDMRAANGRMPGKRNFPARREDAQSIACRRRRWTQQERRFDNVGPLGECLHGRLAPVVGGNNHAQWIAAARMAAENVKLEVAMQGHEGGRAVGG